MAYHTTLIKDDITFTNINILKTINTHNTELQLIKIHIGKTKDITVANTDFPPRYTTWPHYNTVDTAISYCIRHVTNIWDSILTGDVNAHSTLWYSHTDDHRGQLISDIISNSEHITLNTDTPTSPDITTISTTLYNRTTWHTIHALNSDHLPIITTINTRTKYKLQRNRHRGCFLWHSTTTRHTHCKHHLHKHNYPHRQTQHLKTQDTLHMQTTPRTHKTQNRTQKLHQSTKRKWSLDLRVKLCNHIPHTNTQIWHMEGTPRHTLGSQKQHTLFGRQYTV